MIKYVSVSQMQAIEREANRLGLTYERMMANAGLGLAEVIRENYGYLAASGALGLVGSGNNGGDTLVALTHLADDGWKSTAMIIRARPKGDPLIEHLLAAGGQVIDISETPDYELINHLLVEHGLLLDGVLGTGTRLPLHEDLAKVLKFIRSSLSKTSTPPCIIAVDCPSGIDCDSGEAAPDCIPATHTVTMEAVKHGLLKFPAYGLVGDLDVVEIGLPDGGQGYKAWRDVSTFIPDGEWVRQVLPARPLDAHKGTFGTALIVAGSENYTGAALLAGQAAYRIGAGLVTLAIPRNLHAALAGHFPEATWLPLPQENGAIAAEAAERVLGSLEHVTAMLVGCGLGLSRATANFLEQLIAASGLPALVIDADGLKLLSTLPDWHQRIQNGTVLTPHPGEMAIMTGLSIGEIQSNRLQIAQRFSQLWSQVIILKGAFTIIAAPDGQAAVIPVASPALARAGTGDVLAGMVVGLRAQGAPAFEAAVSAAWIHASAGVRAASAYGNSASVLAGDVLRHVADALADNGGINNGYRRGSPPSAARYYHQRED